MIRDHKQFEAVHKLAEFGAVLENELPAWEESVNKEKAIEIAKKCFIVMKKVTIMQCTGLAKEDILAIKNQDATAYTKKEFQ